MSDFARDRYFNGYSDNRSVQENFDLITSFIQESADKHIPSKTSRSVSSVPWITPEIRRKIRRRNKTHAKAKKTGSSKLRSKFETLRREIKADVKKQHDLYVNNLVGDIKANPRDFYRYINGQKKDTPTNDLVPPIRHVRNHHSLAFQTPFANTDIYKCSFFPQTIRDWNSLTDTFLSAAEGAEDSVAKFTSLVRARD